MIRKLQSNGISRRSALRSLMAGAGASAALPVLGETVLASASTPQPPPAETHGMTLGFAKPPDASLTSPGWKPKFFDAHQNDTVVALSDLMVPETDTPGAKAAQANRFIDLLLDAESSETQQKYYQALAWLDGHCLVTFAKPFIDLDPHQQEYMLTLLTHPNDSPSISRGIELFKILKDSIVQAYYRSEVGLLKELKYQTNPYQSGMPGCKHSSGH